MSERALLLRLRSLENPHQFLGLHPEEGGEKAIYFWAPGKERYFFKYLGEVVEANCIDPAGLFSYLVPCQTTRFDYKILYPEGKEGYDPYSFPPMVNLAETYLFEKGIHYQIYNFFGAHEIEWEGVKGVRFTLFAPHAKGVSVVMDLNEWKEKVHPMRKLPSGIWELFIPLDLTGAKYKYAVLTSEGKSVLKSDPYAQEYEAPPRNSSIVTPSKEFFWRDSEWMHKRMRSNPLDAPMNIYEMHLGSWLKKKGQPYNYREMASEIVPYLKEMGMTHLALLPMFEHVTEISLGYEITGFFAPTKRYGNAEDFAYFINHLHMHNIGVLIDWNGKHFPEEAFAKFDGTNLYEKEGKGFDYGKKWVSNFLMGSLLFWLERMHIDGIKITAAEFLIYDEQGRENSEGMEFLKHANSVIHEKFPGVVMIAADSSQANYVTKPLEWGGLGFDLKWHTSWVRDSLSFIQKDPIHRKYAMHELINSYQHQGHERFLLPFSHERGRVSLLARMPLSENEQFAQARLYYSAAMCHPGKKLFFMGIEIGQRRDWDPSNELDWAVLKEHLHIKWKRFVRKMNHFYLRHKALFEIDFDKKGFAWIDYNDYNHSVISYIRKGITSKLVCVHNYTGATFDEYIIRLPGVKEIKEVFNSDSIEFGGSGRAGQNVSILEDKTGFSMVMPPLATIIFEVVFDGEEAFPHP